jgi:hypothetical protein
MLDERAAGRAAAQASSKSPFLDRVETVLAEARSMPVPHPRVEPGS